MPITPVLPPLAAFRADFRTPQHVMDMGGVITGKPTIENGLTFTAESTQAIEYQNNSLLNGMSGFTIEANILRVGGNFPTTPYICRYDANTAVRIFNLNCGYAIGNNYLWLSYTNTIYGQYQLTAPELNRLLHVVWVYNGTGSGNAGRTQLYIDGVAKTLTFTGTVASALNIGQVPLRVGNVGVLSSQNGDRLRSVQIYEGWPATAADALAMYQNTLMLGANP